MQARARAAPARGDAFGQHVHHRVEVRPLHLGVGRGAAAQREELILVPFLGGAGCDDLLGEHVERGHAHGDAIDLAATGRPHEGRALDELVAGEGKEPPLGYRAQGVSGAADALESGGDGARRAEETGEIHRAHVDAELEGSGGHHHRQLARLEPLLGGEAPLPAQAAVMRRHRVLAQPLREVEGHALHEPPRVHEDQRRPVGAREVGDAVVDLRPLLVGAHRAQLVAQHLDCQIQIAPLAHVDDGGQGTRRSHEKPGRRLHRPHRRGEPDALRRHPSRLGHQRVETLQRQREVGATLVAGHRVDLVHDDRAHAGQPAPPGLGGEEDVERLGRRDEHVGWPLRALPAFGRRGVSSAHGGADVEGADAHPGGEGAELAERLLEVAADVVGQRAEGRDVHHLGAVFERAVRGLAHEGVQAMEEGGEGLARAGGSGEKHVVALGDDGPALGLNGRGLDEAPAEPRVYQGMEHAFSIASAASRLSPRPAGPEISGRDVA